MQYKFIQFDVTDRIATITLNRPAKLNALNDAVIDELDGAIDAVRSEGRHRRSDPHGIGRKSFCLHRGHARGNAGVSRETGSQFHGRLGGSEAVW